MELVMTFKKINQKICSQSELEFIIFSALNNTKLEDFCINDIVLWKKHNKITEAMSELCYQKYKKILNNHPLLINDSDIQNLLIFCNNELSDLNKIKKTEGYLSIAEEYTESILKELKKELKKMLILLSSSNCTIFYICSEQDNIRKIC